MKLITQRNVFIALTVAIALAFLSNVFGGDVCSIDATRDACASVLYFVGAYSVALAFFLMPVLLTLVLARSVFETWRALLVVSLLAFPAVVYIASTLPSSYIGPTSGDLFLMAFYALYLFLSISVITYSVWREKSS